MAESSPITSNIDDQAIKSALKQNGYFNAIKMTKTLQGSIWSAIKPNSKQSVVIKVTNKSLHSESIVMINDKKYFVHENILKERAILKYLTTNKDTPTSIVKYIGWFTDEKNYYLVMENGGSSLFDFVTKAHQYIKIGKIDIAEWHKLVQLLFEQMVKAVDYHHNNNVANFDISLENMLINDVDVCIDDQENLKFVIDDKDHAVQLKICDLGLAEIFKTDENGKCSFITNKICGKSNYKSPEMIANKDHINAASNDIWCLGVTLFMMLIGGSPFVKADINDPHFRLIINGNIKKIIEKWGRTEYITKDELSLLELIFKPQDKRITMSDLKQHPWLN